MYPAQRSILRATGSHHGFPCRVIIPHKQLIRALHYDGRNRLSSFWTPTGGISKSIDPATGKEDSHDMLLRAGFIRQTHSGLYQFLPLGLRVQDKIERLLDKHMTRIGASKVSLSTLSAIDLWEQSGRWNADRTEFFRLEDRKGAGYLLSPTHEEEITRLVGDAVHSYRDLPLRLYQITRKYRDELRPRQGLLRTREFLMKDLYTFDVDRETAVATYEDVRRVYSAFFDEFKLPYLVADADSGNIGGDFSHEYHYVSRKGEDDVYKCHACDHVINGELLKQDAANQCPSCHEGQLGKYKSVELGHTFFLGTKYTEPLNAHITMPNSGFEAKAGSSHKNATREVAEDQQTKSAPVQMGCYGIGVSRLIATMADLKADERGLQWPGVMAPFSVVIVPERGAEEDATRVYDMLTMPPTPGQAYVDAIIDDRPAYSLIWKLHDADLIGYSIIIVLGKSWKKRSKVEVQCRALDVKRDADMADVPTFVRELLGQL